MSKLKVVLIVDTEGDFYYNIPSPHFKKKDIIKWKINRIVGRYFRYARPTSRGVLNIVSVLKENKFPACFCIAGHLYLKECDGGKHFSEIKPENKWYYNKIGKNWYYWDKGGSYSDKPGFYFGKIIEEEMKENKLFSFGLHGFAHEALTLERKEVIESIVKSGVDAAKRIGIKVNSFASPFDMSEDEKSPGVIFKILNKYNIKNLVYAGKDNGFMIKRKFDIQKIKKINKVNRIWLSGYFEGSFNFKKMIGVIKDINKNIGKEGVYCIATHDFTHKNKKNVEFIVRYLKKLESENKIEILNINNLK